jgi:hypothetical protein
VNRRWRRGKEVKSAVFEASLAWKCGQKGEEQAQNGERNEILRAETVT